MTTTPEAAQTSTTIDVGEGMRSADITDGKEDWPDLGTCPTCRDLTIRIKKDDTLFRHWTRNQPRRRGYPPCPGTGQKPTILNEYRVTRYLAQKRQDASSSSAA